MTVSNNVRDNTDRHRFELGADGHVAFSNYRRDGNILTIMHTEVPAALNGKASARRWCAACSTSRVHKG